MPLGDFLRRIGADLTAKYVAFNTADMDGKLYGNIDMKTALHPQTLLATNYADGPDRRSVRLSAATEDVHQARLQESEMDYRHRR